MTSCQQFRKSIMDLLDNELDIFQKKNLEKHLKECLSCSNFLSQARLLKSYLKKLPRIKASENFQILLRERIRREMAGKKKLAIGRTSFVKRWVPAFGIVFFLIIMGVWVFNQGIPFSHSSRKVAVNSARLHHRDTFNGKVQYVIDDFPSRTSLSNPESHGNSSSIKSDSLLLNNGLEEVKAHLTPVSF